MYDVEKKIRYSVLYVGEILDEGHLGEWVMEVKSGNILQALITDKKNLNDIEATLEELDTLNEFNLKLIRKHISRLKDIHGKHKCEYPFVETIYEVDQRCCFKQFIKKVRAEILCWPLKFSSDIPVGTGIKESLDK